MITVISVSSRRRGLCSVQLSAAEEYDWTYLCSLQTPESINKRADKEKYEHLPDEEDNSGQVYMLLINAKTAEENGIISGRRMEYSELVEILSLSAAMRARSRAVYLLSRQDYAQKIMYQKLRTDFGDRAAAETVAYLADMGYMNDHALANRLARAYLEANMSRRGAIQKLCDRGISRGIADECVGEYANETGHSERSALMELIPKKYRYALSGEAADMRRAVNALMRRGYSYGDIKAAMDLLLDDNTLDYED